MWFPPAIRGQHVQIWDTLATFCPGRNDPSIFHAALGTLISMDERGAWRDDVFVERFWRTIKYEEIYLYT
jgi:hypothetical protein